jgi:hypothetical protein
VAYVRQVVAVSTILANLDRFAFDDARPEEPLATSDLEVPPGAPFSAGATAAGTGVQRLHDLNPEYLSEVVPNTGFAMVMHLPSAGLARAKEMLIPLLYSRSGSSLARPAPDRAADAASPARAPEALRGGGRSRTAGASFYRVQEGDTLDSLATRFGVDKRALALDNALDPTAGLQSGQLLTIRRRHEEDSVHPAP